MRYNSVNHESMSESASSKESFVNGGGRANSRSALNGKNTRPSVPRKRPSSHKGHDSHPAVFHQNPVPHHPMNKEYESEHSPETELAVTSEAGNGAAANSSSSFEQPSWLVGDVVFAWHSDQWLPAIVTYEPSTGNHVRKDDQENEKNLAYFVQFFDESSPSSWTCHIKKFEGLSVHTTELDGELTSHANSYRTARRAMLMGRLERRLVFIKKSAIMHPGKQVVDASPLFHKPETDATVTSAGDRAEQERCFKAGVRRSSQKSLTLHRAVQSSRGTVEVLTSSPVVRTNGLHGRMKNNPTRKPMSLMLNQIQDGKGMHRMQNNGRRAKQNGGACLSTWRSRTTAKYSSTSVPPNELKLQLDRICMLCEKSCQEPIITCDGSCGNSFHASCLGLDFSPVGQFYCDECQSGLHLCFICHQPGVVSPCKNACCSKFYHEQCLNDYYVDMDNIRRPECPRHTCSFCVSDKVQCRGRLVRCTRCPTSYHYPSCMVAGCVLLTRGLMVCHRHLNRNHSSNSVISTSWCFVCAIGGSLVCCERCPASFHPSCIHLTDVDRMTSFVCDTCKEGKLSRVGDLVWAKVGHYRWWPAKILDKDEIPLNVAKMNHGVGQFALRFFGTGDYCWSSHSRIFPYHEGDKGFKSSRSNRLEKHFAGALKEVEEAFRHRTIDQVFQGQRENHTVLKPPRFQKLKTNRHVSAVRRMTDPSQLPLCECDPSSCNPCGEDSRCLNRMMQFECSSRCLAADSCCNKRMQRRQYKSSEPFYVGQRGWGLRALEDIKSGEFVIEYVGELIDDATCRERIQQYHAKGVEDYYMLVIERDCIIDAGPAGNYSRFMNHCCDPNCVTQKWTVNGEVRVGLFATRIIKAGEELTFHYNLDCLGNEKKPCYCGSTCCSGFIGAQKKPTGNHSPVSKKKKPRTRKTARPSKKLKISQNSQDTEDECYICGGGGQVVICSKKDCPKVYHTRCLHWKTVPKYRWYCPWHFCDQCGRKSSLLCTRCPNSYCPDHGQGMFLQESSSSVLVCLEHV